MRINKRRVRLGRTSQELSQEEFADLVGTSKSTVKRVEAGHDTSLLTFARIARALGTTVDELLIHPKRKDPK